MWLLTFYQRVFTMISTFYQVLNLIESLFVN